jgi:SAM-dependent methyltransferase
MDVECIEASAALADQAELIHPSLAGRIHRGAVPPIYPAQPASLDGVYAVASLMHLKKPDLEQTLDLIHRSLKTRGRLFFSIPLRRPGLDDGGFDRDGRFFLMMEVQQWDALLRSKGFTLLQHDTIGDGLGREDLLWGNWLWEKDQSG